MYILLSLYQFKKFELLFITIINNKMKTESQPHPNFEQRANR